MAKNHKLYAVVRHEYLTIVKQPSFWISLVAVPLLLAVITLINMLPNDSNVDDPLKENLSIAVIDESSLLSQDVIKSYGLELKESSEKSNLINNVKNGQIDGLIVYPKDLEKSGKYQVVSDDTDDENGVVVSEIGRMALRQSLLSPLGNEELSALAVSGGEQSVSSFKNGEPAREISEYIIPGAFLVVFYIVLVFSVSYALTSVSEEKENRSIEMVLSYVKPRTLIQGKLLGIILVTLTQIAIIAAMAGASYIIGRAFGNDLSLPFELSSLTVVPFEILIGASFLVVGFIFYVALMAMIGAIFPSSKEAAGFSTVFFVLPAVPFWGMDMILNEPTSIFTQILTYFPLTSPTTVLLRNATGNLSPFEGIVSLIILVLATFLTILLTAKAFRLGTLEYSERVKFISLFK